MSASWSDATNDRPGFPTPLRVVTDTEATAAAERRLIEAALRLAKRFVDYDHRGWESMKVRAGDELVEAAKEMLPRVQP